MSPREENADLLAEITALRERVASLTRENTELQEQQTATSEVLKIISRSTLDLTVILKTVAENATRLCGAQHGHIFQFDGEVLRFAAGYGTSPELKKYFDAHPVPLGPGSASGLAASERRSIQIDDILAVPSYQFGEAASLEGWRTVLAVPMLKDSALLGTITIWRTKVQPFSDRQIALVETFADQAVIAIENVRLFNETKDALERQTATSEILRVISMSPADVQPVFDVIAEAAMRLCGAVSSLVTTFDGKLLHLCAKADINPEYTDALRHIYPRAPDRGFAAGRAILSRGIVHIPDMHADTEYEHRYLSRVGGLRGILAVPMLRNGIPIGTVNVHKTLPGPFPDEQIALLQAFAAQAVIAIENVRLFKELEARTRELTHSVEQLLALGEVSQAVSSTLELETVLATIVSRAVQMSGSYEGIVYEFDEATQTFHARVTHQITPEHLEALRRTPVRLGEGIVGRAGVLREPVQVTDIEAEGHLVAPQVRELNAREGMRSVLAVPLVREDRLFGGLVILRRDRGAFPPEVVATLRTLAAQSVLAIQNARLFREIEIKSRQLEVASQHKSEFLANMSHELRTPLNAIIGFSEVLTDRMFGDLNEKQDEYLRDIYDSGTHLLSLINDILDLSKIEAGRMELELTDFHLPTAFDNALMLVRERAGRRNITLQTTVDERLGEVRADERKIRQVVLNLLSNAIKFTPEGGRIEVGAVPKDGFVEVSVSDTGVGIAPEDQGRVFEEFRQVGTAEKKAEGTGLGLTLCRKFIELHGGKIWVKSQLGAGSAFTFTIPVRRGE